MLSTWCGVYFVIYLTFSPPRVYTTTLLYDFPCCILLVHTRCGWSWLMYCTAMLMETTQLNPGLTMYTICVALLSVSLAVLGRHWWENSLKAVFFTLVSYNPN